MYMWKKKLLGYSDLPNRITIVITINPFFIPSVLIIRYQNLLSKKRCNTIFFKLFAYFSLFVFPINKDAREFETSGFKIK